MEAHKRSLVQSFKAMAKSGNQTLTKSELRAGFKKAGIILTDAEFNELFSKMDLNNNGTVSCSEYVTAAKTSDVLNNSIQLQSAFRILAETGENSVKRDVLMTAMSKGWLGKVKMANLFNAAYSAKDDPVTFSL